MTRGWQLQSPQSQEGRRGGSILGEEPGEKDGDKLDGVVYWGEDCPYPYYDVSGVSKPYCEMLLN